MSYLSKLFFGLIAVGTLLLSSASPDVRPETYTVEIKDMKFVPAVLSVNKGDIVIWINKDMVMHDVTGQKAKSWKSPPLSQGKSWKKVITEDVDYFCSFHPVMKGKVELR